MNTPHNVQSTDYSTIFSRQRRSCLITQTLKEQLLSGAIKPGDKLPTEAAMCAAYGVSRTTMREAIQTLRSAGLLDVTPGRGSYVRKPNITEALADFALVGKMLDTGGMGSTPLIALLLTDALYAAVRAPLAQRQALFAHIVERSAPPTVNAEREEGWYIALAKLSGNPLTELMLGSLLKIDHHARVKTYADPDTCLRTYPVHMRVTQAIIEGDLTTARRSLGMFLDPNWLVKTTPDFAQAA